MSKEKVGMKLKKLIPFMDPFDQVVIWANGPLCKGTEDDKLFNGSVMDIPWYIAEMHIYMNTEDDTPGFRSSKWRETNSLGENVDRVGLVINVWDE